MKPCDTSLGTRWKVWSAVALLFGALLFLFPFYYMVIGSLQLAPDQTVAGA